MFDVSSSGIGPSVASAAFPAAFSYLPPATAHKSPMPHQINALTAISDGLTWHDRATVLMACGTGKSLVSLWAAEQSNARTILVLVPSLSLVSQLLNEWLSETSWSDLDFMCVCSDQTVASGVDDLDLDYDLLDFPVSTGSEDVHRFLNTPSDGVKLVFSTYQSAQVVADGLNFDPDAAPRAFDLGIFDEAHKTASKGGSYFGFALEDANLPINKRLFFTATPRHYEVRNSALAYSMDREDLYGPVVYSLSFAEAVRLGIICDYKIIISVVTSDMVNDELLTRGSVMVHGEAVNARQVALQIATEQSVLKYGVNRIITFHGSVAEAESFTADDGNGIRTHLPDFETLHVNGKMTTRERDQALRTFRTARRSLISNARCLTEGVDVPAVDMVSFISPRSSTVDIVQAAGRVMRTYPGKEFGYVMIPLFVEQALNETIEQAIVRTGFDGVWDVLSAMRDQDDSIVDMIRVMQEDIGRNGFTNNEFFNDHIEFVGDTLSLKTIKDSITSQCLEVLGHDWDQCFGALLAHQDKYGDINADYSNNPNLGSWVSAQRRLHHSGNLSQARQDRLNAVGFSWVAIDYRWEHNYQALIAYKLQHGDTRVPQSHPTRLGAWVSAQRQLQSKGKLSQERKERLDNLGFIWEALDHRWETSFQASIDWKIKSAAPDSGKMPKDVLQWETTQRALYKDGKLSEERIQKLEHVGFIWDPMDSQWEAYFRELIQFQDKNAQAGNTLKLSKELGGWVNIQRRNYRNGKLSAGRTSELDAIGFVWELPDTQWEDRLRELTDYSQVHGHTNVPMRHETGLGLWVGAQRKAYRLDKVLPHRKDKLDAIGFIWSEMTAKWSSRMNELAAYKQAHGDLMVPTSHPGKLGVWAVDQRRLFKLDRMPQDRIEQLNAIGFVWDTLAEKWECKYQELVDYQEVNSDYEALEKTGSDLGRWVTAQKRAHKDGTLTEERKEKLESIYLFGYHEPKRIRRM